MHRVRKKVTGTCREAPQGADVKASTQSRGVFEQKIDGPQCVPRNRNIPDIIIIEDNGDSEVENNDTETSLRRSQSHSYSSSSGHSGSKSSFATYEISASSSDEDDCVVIEPHAPAPGLFANRKFRRAGKRPRVSTEGIPHESNRKKRSSPSDLSDCEIVLDFDGKVRQDWEEAALRRRTGKARRVESEESTSASIHANSDAKRSPKESYRGDWQFHVKRSWEQACGAGSSSHVKEKKEDGALDQQDSNLNVLDAVSDDSAEEALSCPGQDLDDNLNSANVGISGNQLFDGVEASGRGHDNDICMKLSQCVETISTPTAVDKVVTDRERLKKTEEFRQADEEEWARRRLELQKQAEEVQREKKKRKLEAERQIKMEARQKRRLDEIRQSQLKEEQASGFKDQVRDRVQSELERIAATCRDMASLLRRLGVPVDGGAFATDQQVAAAYKKALLRFHPDRAAAFAKSDPASQVEAEEKFKLVSRMKGVLPFVSQSCFR